MERSCVVDYIHNMFGVGSGLGASPDMGEAAQDCLPGCPRPDFPPTVGVPVDALGRAVQRPVPTVINYLQEPRGDSYTLISNYLSWRLTQDLNDLQFRIENEKLGTTAPVVSRSRFSPRKKSRAWLYLALIWGSFMYYLLWDMCRGYAVH
jgi:hypothetical protein